MICVFTMVEVRGIEPLSEDSVVQFSSSAVCILTFPPRHARRRAYRFSSFMVPGYGKAYIAPFLTSMTPVG